MLACAPSTPPWSCSSTVIRASQVSSTTPREIADPADVSSKVSLGMTNGFSAPLTPNQPAVAARKAFAGSTAGTGLALVGCAACGGP